MASVRLGNMMNVPARRLPDHRAFVAGMKTAWPRKGHPIARKTIG